MGVRPGPRPVETGNANQARVSVRKLVPKTYAFGAQAGLFLLGAHVFWHSGSYALVIGAKIICRRGLNIGILTKLKSIG
jgi:hypothetical protein